MTVLVIHVDKDHLNHCFHPHQRVSNRSYFMPLVICIVTSPVSISVFFVWPRPYLFTIPESGHILLNYLAAAWSAILKESLCSKQFSFHYFWSKFAVNEMAPKSVNFLCCCAGPTYPLCFVVSLCLSISFSPPCATLKSLPHSIQNKTVTFPGYLIFYNLYTMNRWTSHSTSSTLTELVLNSPPSFLQCFDFFHSTNFTW